MSLEKLVSKYIGSTEHALESMEIMEDSINIDKKNIEEIVKYVKAYCGDTKYYRDKKKFEISLTSIAYCEAAVLGGIVPEKSRSRYSAWMDAPVHD